MKKEKLIVTPFTPPSWSFLLSSEEYRLARRDLSKECQKVRNLSPYPYGGFEPLVEVLAGKLYSAYCLGDALGSSTGHSYAAAYAYLFDKKLSSWGYILTAQKGFDYLEGQHFSISIRGSIEDGIKSSTQRRKEFNENMKAIEEQEAIDLRAELVESNRQEVGNAMTGRFALVKHLGPEGETEYFTLNGTEEFFLLTKEGFDLIMSGEKTTDELFPEHIKGRIKSIL